MIQQFCFYSHVCFLLPLSLSNITLHILSLLYPPLLPLLRFSPHSCLKLRTEQLVIEDHCLSSGSQDLQYLLLQLILARQFFGPLFLFAFFLSSSSLSSHINSTSLFWNWIFIWDGPGAPVVFMPPSSHQFSFLFSSLHFSPFPLLSPPVNYLLSVQLGQELHFRPDGSLKKKEGIEHVRKRRSWEDADPTRSGRQCSWFSVVCWSYRTFWPRLKFYTKICRKALNYFFLVISNVQYVFTDWFILCIQKHT